MAVGLLAAVLAAPALARDAERPRIAIQPRVVTYGETARLDAHLVAGSDDAGTTVALLERRLPGDGKYRELERTKADAEGAVRFVLQPSSNAYYAVRTRSDPVQTSLGLLVRVRPLVELALSGAAPARLAPVTLSGSIEPAVGGAKVTAQRRDGRRWRRVASTTAQTPASGGDGPGRSSYQVSFSARRSGRYRVVVAATEALSRGISPTARLRVGAASGG